jgi:signal transduction histidine kinase
MTIYLLLPLIQTIFSLALIVVVLKGHFRSLTHRLFSLFLLSLAIWGVMIFGMRASPDIEHAYSWEKWLVAVAPFTSVLFYHFAIRYTTTRVKQWLLPFLYTICFLFIPLAAAGLIVSGMQMKPYGYAPVFGLAGFFNVLFTLGVSLMAFLTFVRTYRTSAQAEQKNRAAYIIIAMIFSFIGVAFDFLPILGLPLYPGYIIGNIIFCLLVTIAIVKYNLLDIRIVIRKGTAYVLTSAVVAVPFIVIFLLATKIFTEVAFPLWVYFVVAIALALILPQLWQWVQRWVDRWYYRDRYDYLKALETFSQQTQSLTDSARLGSTMVNLLAKALRSSNVYLLQPLPPSNDFTTVYHNDVRNPVVLLKNGGALVKWLERSNNMLSYDDIKTIPQLQGITAKEIKTLQQIGAELIFSLKAPTGRLSGILILGKKLSEQPYTSEDKQLIYTICNQMSTNLENMRLYNESQHEISERKLAEEALQTEKNKLQSVIDAMEDGLTIRDRDYNISYQNKPTRIVYGDRTGEKCYRVYEGRDKVCDGCPAEKAFRDGKSHTSERKVVTPSGEVTFWENTANPIRDAKGNIVSCLELGRNITERKQAEEREKELQREIYLSSRLASIGELAAGIAHQLNNPLTGVLGFSQRLLRKITDKEAIQDLKKIYSEAERAAKIVQNLLTFARRREPKKEYYDVNTIVRSALELRAYELKTSNIEVTINLAHNLPKIMVDFHQIQEVFLNLILNAEQAMTGANSGGKLTIKTEKNKRYIRTTFTDDGPGIPAGHLDNIFDPFYTTKGEKGGTGLGLSVCHGIISEHGGRIYAKSKLGKGTTFFVELSIMSKKPEKNLVENKRAISK